MEKILSSLRSFIINIELYSQFSTYGAVPVQKIRKVNGLKVGGAKLLGEQFGACTVMFKVRCMMSKLINEVVRVTNWLC